MENIKKLFLIKVIKINKGTTILRNAIESAYKIICNNEIALDEEAFEEKKKGEYIYYTAREDNYLIYVTPLVENSDPVVSAWDEFFTEPELVNFCNEGRRFLFAVINCSIHDYPGDRENPPEFDIEYSLMNVVVADYIINHLERNN